MLIKIIKSVFNFLHALCAAFTWIISRGLQYMELFR